MSDRGERHLPWEDCYNVRDAGGYTTEDGHRIRWRVLVRADSLTRLLPSGKRALAEYGVRTIVDLRSDSELKTKEHPFAHSTHSNPTGPNRPNGVTYLNVPVIDEADADGAAGLRDAPSTRELNAVLVERCAGQFARAVQTFAWATEGGVLIHCQVGKDRTGVLTALLLSLAGVPDATIAEDYALSDVYLRPVFEELLLKTDGPLERARMAARLSCTPENMLATLDLIRSRYGSVADYLRASGATAADVERARDRLSE